MNNGAAPTELCENYAQAHTHAKKSAPEQNKLLEAQHSQLGKRMDARAAQAGERSNQAVETVGAINRAEKRGG